MTDLAHSNTPHQRRFWVAEIAVLVGIVALAGFALLVDARATPDQLMTDITNIVSR